MSSDNRFKPPEAAVADVETSRVFSPWPVYALTAVGAVTIVWYLRWVPGFLELVSSNAMNPIMGLTCLLTMLSLAAGLVLAFPRGLRGQNSFLAAAILSVLSAVKLQMPSLATPFILAAAVAVAGLILVSVRKRASRAP